MSRQGKFTRFGYIIDNDTYWLSQENETAHGLRSYKHINVSNYIRHANMSQITGVHSKLRANHTDEQILIGFGHK